MVMALAGLVVLMLVALIQYALRPRPQRRVSRPAHLGYTAVRPPPPPPEIG
jgi:hypothetical protein